MEVKLGYKLTDVGVIPEDWCVFDLDGAARVVDSLHQTPGFTEDGYAMVRVTDIKTGNLNLGGTLKVSKAAHEQFVRNYRPKRGDIVLSRVGSYGVSSFVETDEPFCMGQNTVVLEAHLPARFLYYALNSHCVRRQIEDGSYGSGYKSLSLKNVRELKIPAPPTDPEQRAIGDALCDADTLIESLAQLLAKKRHLKQAAMQQLLTGQTRLPGFTAKWETKALGDVATASKGIQLSIDRVSNTGRFAHLNGGMSPSGYTDESSAPGDTIAISEGGNSCGYVQLMAQPFWCGGHCYAVKPIGVDNHFLYQALKAVESSIMALRVGSGLPNVQKTALLEFKLRLPAIPEEQTAIAGILSDMDGEIAALEAKLAKARHLKQGMMQELLTGRTRLV